MRSLSALSLSLMVATVSSTPLHAAAQTGDEDAMQKPLSTIINAADVDMPPAATDAPADEEPDDEDAPPAAEASAARLTTPAMVRVSCARV